MPNPYTVYNPPTDIWGICGTSYSSTSSNPQVYGYADVVAPFLAGITTASDGNHYWGVQDITNPYSDTVWTNGSIRDSATLANLNVQNIPSFPVFGGAFWHTIDFAPVPLPIGGPFDVKLAFDYYVNGFDSGDNLGYQIAYDDSSNWGAMNVLFAGTSGGGASTSGWETFEITLDSTASFVRLRVGAIQNGGNDFGSFDNFRVFLDVGDLTPPSVVDLWAPNSNTLMCAMSEPVLNATPSSFSGVSVNTVTTNSTNDTLTLNLFSMASLFSSNNDELRPHDLNSLALLATSSLLIAKAPPLPAQFMICDP